MSHIRILWSQCLLSDLQCSLIEWLGFSVVALLFVQSGQTIEWISDIRMLKSESLLSDLQCSLVEWLGLLILALVIVELC